MRIIAGSARNLELAAPPTLAVRPTAVRARKALFDSLGSFAGARVADLFAGSGALGLEAASRGASGVVFIEKERSHASVIALNVERVKKTGVEFSSRIVTGDAGDLRQAIAAAPADLVFADPPYADSLAYFKRLVGTGGFLSAFSGALVVWELPDTPGAVGEFLEAAGDDVWQLRRFGGTAFFFRRLP